MKSNYRYFGLGLAFFAAAAVALFLERAMRNQNEAAHWFVAAAITLGAFAVGTVVKAYKKRH